MSNLYGACVSADGFKVICNYGEAPLLKGETAAHAASRCYVRWLEEGWKQGGYKPMTRAEFEATHPEVLRG